MNVRTVLKLVVLGLALYSGVQMAIPWVQHKVFSEEMKDQARNMAVVRESVVKERLLGSALSNRIPLDPRELVVVKDHARGLAYIEARYQIVSHLPFGYTYTWSFNPRFEGRIPVGGVPDL